MSCSRRRAVGSRQRARATAVCSGCALSETRPRSAAGAARTLLLSHTSPGASADVVHALLGGLLAYLIGARLQTRDRSAVWPGRPSRGSAACALARGLRRGSSSACGSRGSRRRADDDWPTHHGSKNAGWQQELWLWFRRCQADDGSPASWPRDAVRHLDCRTTSPERRRGSARWCSFRCVASWSRAAMLAWSQMMAPLVAMLSGGEETASLLMTVVLYLLAKPLSAEGHAAPCGASRSWGRLRRPCRRWTSQRGAGPGLPAPTVLRIVQRLMKDSRLVPVGLRVATALWRGRPPWLTWLCTRRAAGVLQPEVAVACAASMLDVADRAPEHRGPDMVPLIAAMVSRARRAARGGFCWMPCGSFARRTSWTRHRLAALLPSLRWAHAVVVPLRRLTLGSAPSAARRPRRGVRCRFRPLVHLGVVWDRAAVMEQSKGEPGQARPARGRGHAHALDENDDVFVAQRASIGVRACLRHRDERLRSAAWRRARDSLDAGAWDAMRPGSQAADEPGSRLATSSSARCARARAAAGQRRRRPPGPGSVEAGVVDDASVCARGRTRSAPDLGYSRARPSCAPCTPSSRRRAPLGRGSAIAQAVSSPRSAPPPVDMGGLVNSLLECGGCDARAAAIALASYGSRRSQPSRGVCDPDDAVVPRFGAPASNPAAAAQLTPHFRRRADSAVQASFVTAIPDFLCGAAVGAPSPSWRFAREPRDGSRSDGDRALARTAQSALALCRRRGAATCGFQR